MSTPWRISRSPVLPKLVLQIRSGKVVNLSELLTANLVSSETKLQLMLSEETPLVCSGYCHMDGRRKPSLCFSHLYIVFPHRWKDLALYKLLFSLVDEFGLRMTKLSMNTLRRLSWPIGQS